MYTYQYNGTDYLLLLYILFMKSQIELYIGTLVYLHVCIRANNL